MPIFSKNLRANLLRMNGNQVANGEIGKNLGNAKKHNWLILGHYRHKPNL